MAPFNQTLIKLHKRPDMDETVELTQRVTKRLVLSLAILMGLSALLLAIFLFTGSSVSIFGVAMVFGIGGGFISIQRRLKTLTKADLQLMARSWPYIFLSPLAGGVLAVILYLIFVSELMTGPLVPSFDPGENVRKDFSRILEVTAKNHQDYAKIMFWSFVAGFSETFVTNIVGTFANRLSDQSQPRRREGNHLGGRAPNRPPPGG